MSSPRRKGKSSRATSGRWVRDTPSSPVASAPEFRGTAELIEPGTNRRRSATGSNSRKLSNGKVTILVATIAAAAGIATATLNGMFNLASSHSAQFSPNTSESAPRVPIASPAPTASQAHLVADPLVAGDNSAFIADVTYPDGTKVVAGQHFVKKWEIRNIGSVAWIGRYLAAYGESTGACTYPSRVLVPETSPGETAIISVTVTAPSTPQVCYVTWKMVTAAGNLYFPNEIGIWFNVRIVAAPARNVSM